MIEGTHIGTYRIERQLGQGGFGVVYIGVDTRLGRRAAIKQLLPQLSNNRDIVERFFNEAKAAANINHAGIVEIYDVGWHTDGSAYFAMKLLDGDSLATRLRSTGPLPIQLATTIARQVSSALVAAHARGIVHRDLKPDNIILVPDDEVAISERATVLDFGIAKLIGDSPLSQKTATGMMMGTPLYMSPEQCRGAGEVDHRTDVYALGCILFEMLAGRAPFIGEGAGEILGMHQFVEPPALRSLRADIPPDLDAIVARTLAKKPDQRYAQMSELQSALQPFAAAGGRSREQPAQASAPRLPVDVSAPTAISERDGPRAAPVAVAGTEAIAPQPALTPPMIVPQTTLGAATGQLETKRKPRAALFAIGGIAVAGAVVAIVVATRSGSTTTTMSNSPGTTQITGETVDALAVMADASEPPAVDAPAVVVAVDAAVSADDEKLLKEIEVAGVKLDFVTVLLAYAKIPKTSSLHQKATDLYYRYGANYQVAQQRLANVNADARECAKNKALVATLRSLEAKYSDVHFTQAIKYIEVLPCTATTTVTKPSDPPPRPPKPDEASSDTDKLISEARDALRKGQWVAAQRKAAQALQKQPGSVEALTLAAMAACKLDNKPEAQRYLGMIKGQREMMVRQFCGNAGVKLD